MRYAFGLSALILAAASTANAIEMFTNFNNGQNIGFPPMEVPISMYRGFGHGGWAPGVVGTPLKTIPPVPAMTPTGRAANFHGGYPMEEMSSSPAVGDAQSRQYVSDRRRGGRWQRGNSVGTSPDPRSSEDPKSSNQSIVSSDSNDKLMSVIKKPGETNSLESQPTKPAPVTILRGLPGTPPTWDSNATAESIDQAFTDAGVNFAPSNGG
jgi:hypothetical protein